MIIGAPLRRRNIGKKITRHFPISSLLRSREIFGDSILAPPRNSISGQLKFKCHPLGDHSNNSLTAIEILFVSQRMKDRLLIGIGKFHVRKLPEGVSHPDAVNEFSEPTPRMEFLHKFTLAFWTSTKFTILVGALHVSKASQVLSHPEVLAWSRAGVPSDGADASDIGGEHSPHALPLIVAQALPNHRWNRVRVSTGA